MSKKDEPKDEKKDTKALTWGERMDADTAGRRWDKDVQDGMGKWKKGS